MSDPFSSSMPLVQTQISPISANSKSFRRSLIPQISNNRSIPIQRNSSSVGLRESLSSQLVEENLSEDNSESSRSNLSPRSSQNKFNLNHPSQHKMSIDLTQPEQNTISTGNLAGIPNSADAAGQSSQLSVTNNNNNDEEFHAAEKLFQAKQERAKLSVRERGYLKMQEWNEGTTMLILQNLVPDFITELTQDLAFWVEQETEECVKAFDVKFQECEAVINFKERESARLKEEIVALKARCAAMEAEQIQNADNFTKESERIQQRANQMLQARSEYWNEMIRDLTLLFHEAKEFLGSVSDNLPREVYLGEIFKFQRIFGNIILEERTILQNDDKTPQELYHELKADTSSLFIEKDALNEQIELLQKKLARANAMVVSQQNEQEKAMNFVEACTIEKEQFDHKISMLKKAAMCKQYKLERQMQEEDDKRKAQIEAIHRKYIMTINQQDATMKVNIVKCQNLDALAIKLGAENTAQKRIILELEQEIAILRAQIQRTQHCYTDSIKTANLVYELEKEALNQKIEMFREVNDKNIMTLTEYYKSQLKLRNDRSCDEDFEEEEEEESEEEVEEEESQNGQDAHDDNQEQQRGEKDEQIEESVAQNEVIGPNLEVDKNEDNRIQNSRVEGENSMEINENGAKNEMQKIKEGKENIISEGVEETGESQSKIAEQEIPVDDQNEKQESERQEEELELKKQKERKVKLKQRRGYLKVIESLEEQVKELLLKNTELSASWEERMQSRIGIEELSVELKRTLANVQTIIKEKEESDVRLTKQMQRYDNLKLQQKEQERALDEEIKKRRRQEKEVMEQRALQDSRITMISDKAMRDVARLRREADHKADLKGIFERNRKKSFAEIRNSGQLKDIGINAEIDNVFRKAIAAREADVIADRQIAESKVKDFYESAFKELSEHFEQEQKIAEQKQKVFYESLLEQAKKHHNNLEDTLVEDNMETNKLALHETLKRTEALEKEMLILKQTVLSNKMELKRRDLHVVELETEVKNAQEIHAELIQRIHESNLKKAEEKSKLQAEVLEWRTKFRDEEQKGHARMKREKNLTMELHLLQTEMKSRQIIQENEKQWEATLKLQIGKEFESKIDAIKSEASMEYDKLNKEFSQFRVAQTIKYSALKSKYERLVQLNADKSDETLLQQNLALNLSNPSQQIGQQPSSNRSSDPMGKSLRLQTSFQQNQISDDSTQSPNDKRKRSKESWRVLPANGGPSQQHQFQQARSRSNEEKYRAGSVNQMSNAKVSMESQTFFNADTLAQLQYHGQQSQHLPASRMGIDRNNAFLFEHAAHSTFNEFSGGNLVMQQQQQQRDFSASTILPEYRKKLIVKDRINNEPNEYIRNKQSPLYSVDNNVGGNRRTRTEQSHNNMHADEFLQFEEGSKRIDSPPQKEIQRSQTVVNTKKGILPQTANGVSATGTTSTNTSAMFNTQQHISDNLINPALLDHYHNKSKLNKSIYRARKYDIFSLKSSQIPSRDLNSAVQQAGGNSSFITTSASAAAAAAAAVSLTVALDSTYLRQQRTASEGVAHLPKILPSQTRQQ